MLPVETTPLTSDQELCHCGGPLPAAGGLCPKCLLGEGMQMLLTEASQEDFSQSYPAKGALPRRFAGYELLDEIARGGMGIVYRARQISLNRIVAVKMLLFGEFSSDEFVRRFKTEASAAAALQHPNIVAVHEIGEYDGQHFFSMEYVEGRDLAEIVRERPMAPREAAACMEVLARTVQYAHDRCVLHRDLKPSNVLIDEAGHVRLTDFGLAKRLSDDTSISRTGQLLGSPSYMPPEQAAPHRGSVGKLSDVYSLGAVLYHLLTGRAPFAADSLERTLFAVLNDEPLSPRLLNRGVPRDLETICLKCLEKDPSCRYPSAAALADDLERYARGEPIEARPSTPAEKAVRWCRRKPALAAAFALLALIAIGSAATARHLSRMHHVARWDSYVSEVSRAQHEWQQKRFAEAFFYLQKQIPQDGQPDQRGFEWRHLWNLARGNTAARLPVHKDVVSWIGFSADGRSAVTFGWDAAAGVQAWDVATQRKRWTLPQANSVGGFSTDGAMFVAGLDDQSVATFQPDTGRQLTAIRNAGVVVAFAADAKRVVTMDGQHLLKVIELTSSTTVTTLTNVARRFFDVGRNAPVAITADGRWLALIRGGDPSEARDVGIELWDAQAGSLSTFLPLRKQIRLLQFSPKCSSLAIADGDGMVTLWNWTSGRTNSVQAHSLPVQAVAFSRSGDLLATGSSDESVKLWNSETLSQRPETFEGQMGTVWSLAFTPDGKAIASGSRDMPVNIWSLERATTPQPITNLNSEKVGNFVFSGDSRLMAGGCRDNQVRIWDVATQSEKFRLRSFGFAVAFSRDGRRLLVGNETGSAYWWEFATGKREQVPSHDSLGEITCAEFTPDRRMAALGHKSGRIELLEIASGKVIGTYAGHRDAILSLTFTPDGQRFASGSRDKEIRLWDVGVSNDSRQVCTEHKGGVAGLAISGDGRTMVSGCNASTIKFWDLNHLDRSLGARSWHRSAIRSLAFSPDGKRVASGSEDHSVKLWDFNTRRELADFQFEAAVRIVAFSPDGNTLAVVTDKGALHLLRSTRLEEADREIKLVYR